MIAVWATLVLIVAAATAAMTLGWRKWARVPVRSKSQPVERGGCFPRVRR